MWPFPQMLAHRGAGLLAPENTLAAMRQAHARGFPGVEFDVMLTSDDVPILMHDEDFGRTISGDGHVAQTSFSDLAKMDVGSWFSPEFSGERVPLYTDVVAYCRKNAIWMNVEIKPSSGREEITGEVIARSTQELFADVLADINGTAKDPTSSALPLLSSFSFDALKKSREFAPFIPRGLLVDAIPSNWIAQLQELDAMSLHVNHEKLNASLARAVKDAGYALFCYTVNTQERASQLIKWGVDGMCTDYPVIFKCAR